MRQRQRLLAIFICALAVLASGAVAESKKDQTSGSAPARPLGDAEFRARVLEGARAEAKKQTRYIENYEVIDYPGGDVKEGGVCTDLIVRAFRNAGVDLQQRLHEDRKANASAYPTKLWDHKKPDKNIDHRRCQNLVVWFKRHATSLTTSLEKDDLKEWQGGDVVFYVREGASHPWHVAIVSDKRDPLTGLPYVIDSFPPHTREAYLIDAYGGIHSHFRFSPAGAIPKPKQDE